MTIPLWHYGYKLYCKCSKFQPWMKKTTKDTTQTILTHFDHTRQTRSMRPIGALPWPIKGSLNAKKIVLSNFEATCFSHHAIIKGVIDMWWVWIYTKVRIQYTSLWTFFLDPSMWFGSQIGWRFFWVWTDKIQLVAN